MPPTRDNLLERIEIPMLSESTRRVLDLTQDPTADTVDYAALVTQDPALTASVLRLVNSALFSFRHEVVDVRDACIRLGVRNLASLCLSATLARAAEDRKSPVIRACWRHALATGHLARRLAGELCSSQEAYVSTAGLIHSIGWIAILSTEELGFVAPPHDGSSKISWESAGRDQLGFDDAELATAIGCHWKLREEIVGILDEWTLVAGATPVAPWCLALASAWAQLELQEFVHLDDPRADVQRLLGYLDDATLTAIAANKPRWFEEARTMAQLVARD